MFWLSDWSVPNVAVPRLHLHVGDIADTVYHSPSEKLFTAAVTGTNGKTTVTHFAAQLCGVDKSAVIGTLGAGFLGRMQATDNTTPDAASIHALLSDFSAAGAKSAFIEASSHGIAQKRLAGISLNCAAFCNAVVITPIITVICHLIGEPKRRFCKRPICKRRC